MSVAGAVLGQCAANPPPSPPSPQAAVLLSVLALVTLVVKGRLEAMTAQETSK